MPLTKIDDDAALVVIDLQKGIVGMQTAPYPAGEIVSRAAQLARAFRERGLPVVLVSVTAAAPGRTDAGPRKFAFADDWTELAPELERQAGDYVVSKQRVGAFIGTSLQDILRQRRVTQVFLTGIATAFGVESTGRSAYDYGYNVVYVLDAMTDRDAEAHRHSVERIFPRMGETAITDQVLKMLDETAARSSGATD
jgi:nicotinamidase-related amidase